MARTSRTAKPAKCQVSGEVRRSRSAKEDPFGAHCGPPGVGIAIERLRLGGRAGRTATAPRRADGRAAAECRERTRVLRVFNAQRHRRRDFGWALVVLRRDARSSGVGGLYSAKRSKSKRLEALMGSWRCWGRCRTRRFRRRCGAGGIGGSARGCDEIVGSVAGADDAHMHRDVAVFVAEGLDGGDLHATGQERFPWLPWRGSRRRPFHRRAG